MSANQIKVNKFALSWWVFLTLIPGLTFIPFAYAGFSSKDRKLVYAAYLYFVPIFLIDYFPQVAALAWMVGIIHAFSVRGRYIQRRIELKTNRQYTQNTSKVHTSKKEIIKVKINEEVDVKEKSIDNKLNMKKVDLGKENESLMDINYCTEEELEKLPFVNSILAKKAIQKREAIGSFSTVEEFGISIGLKPHMIEKIRPLVVIREKAIKEEKKDKGRVIDL